MTTTLLQNIVDDLVTYILEWETDIWSSSHHNLTKEQAERIALSLIDDWVIEELDSWGIRERYNDLILGDKND